MTVDVFLAPLGLGFALAGASAFTAAYSRCWGERGGQLASSLLRNALGIPFTLTRAGAAVVGRELASQGAGLAVARCRIGAGDLGTPLAGMADSHA